MLAEFQICICVPLNTANSRMTLAEFRMLSYVAHKKEKLSGYNGILLQIKMFLLIQKQNFYEKINQQTYASCNCFA